MRVEWTSLTKFNKLYKKMDSVANTYIGANKTFECNLNQILNNYGILIALEDVSEYDYIFLKKLFSNISPFKKYNSSSNIEIMKNDYKEISNEYNELIKVLETIHDKLLHLTNVDINFYREYIPSGLSYGNCVLYITGYSLESFMDGNPIKFFKDITDKKDKDIRDIVIQKFFNYFYNGITDSIFKNDIISDGVIYNTYNSLFENVEMNLNSITYFPSVVETSRMRYVFNYMDMNYYSLTFAIDSSFGAYFNLMTILPYRCFTTSESINLISKKSIISNLPDTINKFTIGNINLYNDKVKNLENNLLNKIDEEYNNIPNIIKKYELSTNYVNYRYSITLTLSDINNYIGKALLDLNTENSYLDKSDVFLLETKSILNFILDESKDFYNEYK